MYTYTAWIICFVGFLPPIVTWTKREAGVWGRGAWLELCLDVFVQKFRASIEGNK